VSSKLRIKVVPSSSRNAVEGWLGDTLKVRVTAPPERGKANAAVETTIAEALGVSEQTVYRDILFLKKRGHPIRAVRLPSNWAYQLGENAATYPRKTAQSK